MAECSDCQLIVIAELVEQSKCVRPFRYMYAGKPALVALLDDPQQCQASLFPGIPRYDAIGQSSGVFEQDTCRVAMFVTSNAATRWIGCVVVDAGKCERLGIQPDGVTIFARQQRGPATGHPIQVGGCCPAMLPQGMVPA